MGRLRLVVTCTLVVVLVSVIGLQIGAQNQEGPDSTFFDALWVGRTGGALQLDAATATSLYETSDDRSVRAVAVDEVRGRVWLFGEQSLRSLDFTGQVLVDLPTPSTAEGNARMAVQDGEGWLASGRTIQRFDSDGVVVQTIDLGALARDLALDPADGTVRVATSDGLASFDADGNPLGNLPVSGAGATAVAIDAQDGSFWLATQSGLERHGADGTLQFELAVRNLRHLAPDGEGGVWAADPQSLTRFDVQGGVVVSLDPLGVPGAVVSLAAHPADGSVWAATPQHVVQVRGDGQVLLDRALTGNEIGGATTSLALYADVLAPTVAWVDPSDGDEILPNATLVLDVSDVGQGVDPASLSIESDGAELGIACTVVSGEVTCNLDDPLEVGAQTLTATVADFAGNPSAPASIGVTVLPDNRAPVLPPIGDLTVTLGSSLTLPLNAVDPDGDPLTYSVGPVPLPEGARLDTSTGVFTLTPTDDDLGSRPLTFSVTDGQETVSETVTLTIVGGQPGAPTALTGRILDTQDFVTSGLETPIVGVRISLDGSASSTISDMEGRFRLDNVPFGQRVLRLDATNASPAPDGAPYASFQEGILLIEGVVNEVERPFFLPRVDASSATPVDPTTTTEVTNPNLEVTLTVPPNTAKNPDGTNFTGALTISEVPAAVAPVSLPEELEPGLLLTIQPVGVTFTTPVPITLPNLDNLTPGSEVDLWSVDPATGLFQIVGVGVVSADGSVLETVSGGIRAASWHAMMPPQPGSDGSGNNDDNQDPDKCDDCNAGSQTALSSGNLSVAHDLTPYFALNRPRALRLVYNSEQAAPRPILSSRTTISRRAAVPPTTSAGLEVSGLDFGTQIVTDTSGLSESVDEPLRQAVQFDGRGFDTGLYRYRMKVSSHYSRSTISTFQSGRVIVHNRSDSPLGTGWGFSGLQRIHPQSDGTLLVTEGDGKAQVFDPAPIDLRDWRRQGPSGNGNWIVAGDGLSVLQTINGNPTFFVSPNNLIDTVVRGRFQVATSGDDDFVGFVFGYRSPLAENGDDPNTNEFLLFDWKQANQTAFGQFAQEGFTLSRVSGRITDVGRFWGHVEGPDLEVLGTDYGNDKGWNDFQEHDFELVYQRDRVRISIDGRLIFDVAGTFEPGRFGFYNFSQSQVRYRSFTAAALFESPAGDFSTLVRNDDSGFTRTYKDGSFMEFDSNGLQTSAVDAAGNATTYAYDAQGRLTSITDPVGGVTVLAYSGGRLQSVTDPASQTTVFDHDANGHLVGIVDADGSVRQFVYDGTGRLTRQVSKRGFAVDYQYDFAGRNVGVLRTDGSARTILPKATVGLRNPGSTLGSAANPAPVVRPAAAVSTYTDGNGNTAVFETDRFGGSTMTLDAQGDVTTASRDGAGNPLEIVNSNGLRQSFTYDGRGNLTSVEWNDGTETRRIDLDYDVTRNLVERIVDAGGHAFDVEYDGAGNPVRITDPLTGTRNAVYDSRGLLTSLTDENGATTTYVYDADGNTRSITKPDGVTVRFDRDPVGRVTAITEAVGLPEERSTRYTYDAAGRVATFTDAGGAVTRYTYDASGNAVAIETPDGTILRREYDEMNRVTRQDDPIRGVTTFDYDGNGNLIRLVKANGAVTTFEYDEANRMVRSVDPLSGEQRFGYDGRGNLLSFQNANGEAWTYAYDLSDRVTSVTDPLGNTTTFTYDSRNFLASATDANGQTTSYTVDALGRVTTVHLPDNTIRRTFDPTGNILSVEDDDSRVDLTYDAVGRVLTESVVGVGVQPPVTLTHQRDALGRRTGMTDSLGGGSSFGFDARHMTSITTPTGETISLDYDPAGRFQQIALPNGISTDMAYDAAGRLSTLSYNDAGGTLLNLGYTYDVVGNLLSIAEGTRVRSFSYDGLERLVTGGTAGLPEFYDYDAVGNRVASFLSASHLHDAANRLLEDDAFTYGYDANGNLVRRQDKATGDVTVYVYDAQNQLVGIQRPDGSTVSYRYDGIGRRIEKDVAGVVTRYVYDGDDLLLELDGADNLLARYTHGPGADRPVAMERGGAEYYYLADHQGSIRFVLDDAGNAVNSYEYDSFGRRLVETEGIENPFQFTGREFDPESGLYYYRARYYDPVAGRFVSQDPARFDSGSSHFYSYLENDPLNARDPSGMFSFWDALDVASFLWSAAEFIDCPTLGNFGNLLLDGIGLLPIVPGVGTVRRGLDMMDSASDAARLGDRARDAANAADNVNDAVNAADTASDLSRRAQDILGQSDDVVVIGRRPDTAVAGEWDGHTILDVDDWSIDLNDAWVAEAINQGRDVYVASPTTQTNLWDNAADRSTVFGRELQQFLDAGYTRQGDYLVPPGG